MQKNDSLEFISYAELNVAIENDFSSSNYKTAAEFLIDALDTWPKLNLREPSTLLMELRMEVKGRLTYTNLENFSKHQDFNLGVWKRDAINSLLEIFDFERNNKYDMDIDLETIIDKVSKHYSIR